MTCFRECEAPGQKILAWSLGLEFFLKTWFTQWIFAMSWLQDFYPDKVPWLGLWFSCWSLFGQPEPKFICESQDLCVAVLFWLKQTSRNWRLRKRCPRTRQKTSLNVENISQILFSLQTTMNIFAGSLLDRVTISFFDWKGILEPFRFRFKIYERTFILSFLGL